MNTTARFSTCGSLKTKAPTLRVGARCSVGGPIRMKIYIPGLLAAPFVFWQSLPAGVVFCLLWAALVAVVYQRACSYAAALGAETLTVYSGIVFPLRRAVRRRAVTGLFRLRTPLLRLAGVSVVVITAPGTRLVLPAVPAEQAAALTHVLAEEIR